MDREINKACEFSCDEAIISKLDSSNVRDYGKTLLNTMSTVGKYKEILASVTLSENKEILKERIDAIMKFRKQSKSIVALTIMLSLLICCGATYVGGYTDKNKNYNVINKPIKISNIDIASGGEGITWFTMA